MKKALVLLLILFLSVTYIFCSAQKEEKLVVYCYDSFTGDWGPGAKIVEAFKAKTGIDVDLVGCGGALETYSKVIYEGSKCRADVVVGLSGETNIDKSLFEDFKAFDYGIFAFMFDTQSGIEPPKSLKDLTKPYYKDKVVLIDPRTSSVGLGLLKWTVDALGEENAFDWWYKMKDNSLTIASSWSSGYGLFTEGEVPLVISYSTSPVYHVMYEDTTRFQALEFTEGHVKTTEYLGILKSSDKKDKAKLFVDFILNEGQVDIAVANTMFPANETTVLPEAFSWALRPSLLKDDNSFSEKESQYLDTWTHTMVK